MAAVLREQATRKVLQITKGYLTRDVVIKYLVDDQSAVSLLNAISPAQTIECVQACLRRADLHRDAQALEAIPKDCAPFVSFPHKPEATKGQKERSRTKESRAVEEDRHTTGNAVASSTRLSSACLRNDLLDAPPGVWQIRSDNSHALNGVVASARSAANVVPNPRQRTSHVQGDSLIRHESDKTSNAVGCSMESDMRQMEERCSSPVLLQQAWTNSAPVCSPVLESGEHVVPGARSSSWCEDNVWTSKRSVNVAPTACYVVKHEQRAERVDFRWRVPATQPRANEMINSEHVGSVAPPLTQAQFQQMSPQLQQYQENVATVALVQIFDQLKSQLADVHKEVRKVNDAMLFQSNLNVQVADTLRYLDTATRELQQINSEENECKQHDVPGENEENGSKDEVQIGAGNDLVVDSACAARVSNAVGEGARQPSLMQRVGQKVKFLASEVRVHGKDSVRAREFWQQRKDERENEENMAHAAISGVTELESAVSDAMERVVPVALEVRRVSADDNMQDVQSAQDYVEPDEDGEKLRMDTTPRRTTGSGVWDISDDDESLPGDAMSPRDDAVL
eukprot:1357558-Amphidinium_carterae.3